VRDFINKISPPREAADLGAKSKETR